jgi:SAM-dependent methyltransferase
MEYLVSATLIGAGATGLMDIRGAVRFAASRAPRPGRARLESVAFHAVFGLGVYLAALLNSAAASDGWTGFGFSATGPELPRLVQELELRAGAVVADVGAGKGQLTRALAAKVGPNGRVYSTEIHPGRLRQLRSAVAAARLDNVTVVEASASNTGLAPGCCDAIVLRRVYHHLTDPSGINSGLLRALRPGGVLAVVDFPPPFFLGRGEFGVPAESVVAEVTASGFELVRRMDDWPGRGPLGAYCVVFRKAS